MVARLAVKRGKNPVAALPHFAHADGVPRLISVPQPGLRTLPPG